ncbi:MAG: hypothetical protein WAP52_01385 [Candidatus Sungiibacteriota bacterium]
MILGHERQIKYFDRVIAAGRLAHAYLLYGPERVGKRAMAYAIARVLLCPQYAGNSQSIASAGDDCRVCREISAGTHPGLIALDPRHPLVPPKGVHDETLIDDIRELKHRFSFAPIAGAWRIAIIDDTDRMSADAEVSFLKLLEEPGAQTVFLLIASSRDAVPPTIVSRAMPILFAPVPDRVLAPYVRKHLPKENRENMLALARGRAGMIAEWVQNPERLAEEKKNAALFSSVFVGGMADMLALSEKAMQDEVMRRRIQDAWIAYLRRRLTVAAGAERIDVACRITRALDIISVIEDTNINTRLAMDVMFAEGSVK